jgi:FkbM family methyltransferase
MMDNLARTLMTVQCRDSDCIPKVPTAGRIIEGVDGPVQIMHNGLKVAAGGYCGDWMSHIIRSLRGHHEPQEELAFHHLLRMCRHNSLIVELGAYWAYYSLWYLQEVPGSQAVCVEPDPKNLSVGMTNAKLNCLSERVKFTQACIGVQHMSEMPYLYDPAAKPDLMACLDMRAVAELVEGKEIELLHIDAQGVEHLFLSSIGAALVTQRVRFLMVSTHHCSISGSPTTHVDCLRAINDLGGYVLLEHSVQESFSGDGLIVASFQPVDRAICMPQISRNTASSSLFPDL